VSALLIENAEGIFTGLPGESMRAQGSIRIRDGVITAIGVLTPEADERRLDASGCVIYPGLISTHHHLFQSVLKGVQAGIDQPLAGWLRSVPYAYWSKIDEQALAVAARIGLTELLLSGTTTVADHHYLFSDTYRFDPAAVIFEVARSLGLRLVLCRGGGTKTSHVGGGDGAPTPVEPLERMLASVEACAQRFHDPSPAGLTKVAMAPTTPTWSLDPGELREVIAASRRMKLRLHSHLSETSDYVDFCMSVHGKRPVHWLADHDWLGSDIWYAHMVHLDGDEVNILAETGTGMAHCPQSNCRLGSGVAPADALAALGGAVSLGVDGAASNEAADMVCEMHSAWHTHRAVKGANAVTAENVVRWATAGGARVLGLPHVGTLAPGQQADIAVFDLDQPRHFGMHDLLVAPVTCGGARVRHLLIGGRTVVNDGAIPGLDLARLRSDAARVVTRIAA
jgi:cytosine/adenosine deaminase-related metal-dependent hydrolase